MTTNASQLEILARNINAAHDDVLDSERRTLDRGLVAGKLLAEAKDLAGHGNFIPYVEKRTGLSVRRAQEYLYVHKHRDRIPKTRDSAHLSFEAALRGLRTSHREAPKPIPPPIVHCDGLPLDQIIHGDNVQVLGELPTESINLFVTSPPYGDLRTYGGHDWDFEGVAAQLERVLLPGGVIVWVVADQTKDGSESGESFQQALHFKSLGLNLHDTMFYKTHKPPSA